MRLNSQGLHWLSTGYVSMWDRVNKADEAMIDMLPRERVIESAKLDELRLINSGVPDSDNLCKLLKKAVETLSSQKATDTASSDINGPSHPLSKTRRLTWSKVWRRLCLYSLKTVLTHLITRHLLKSLFTSAYGTVSEAILNLIFISETKRINYNKTWHKLYLPS